MRVFVTGGAGYIGSVVTEELVNDGHEVVVYDNLSKGHREAVVAGADFVEGDLLDADKLRQTLKDKRSMRSFTWLRFHSSASRVEQPAKYYHNNVVAGFVLLDAMRECGVSRIVFSSTAATYGEPEAQPIFETAADKSNQSLRRNKARV